MNADINIPIRNILSLLILIAALSNLILGVLILIESPRRRINRLFSLLCINLFFWGVAFFGAQFSLNSQSVVVWSRLYLASLILVAPLLYHLIIGSLGVPLKGQIVFSEGFAHRFQNLAYVITGGWVLFLLKGFLPAQEAAANPILPFAHYFWVTVITYGIIGVTALILLAFNIRRAQDQNQKNRLSQILVGSSVILLGGLFNIFSLYHHKIPIIWTNASANLLITASLILIAYALTSSQMYQFAELSRKTIAFIIMTLLLLLVFGGTNALANAVIIPIMPNGRLFALGIASIMMALLFHPLRYRIQNLVDKLLFSKRFDQMQQLRLLSRRILSSADRDELLTILFSSLNKIGFHALALLLKDPQKGSFHIRRGVGLNEVADGFFLRFDSLLIQYLREEKEELIRDEVLRRILADWERHALSDEMGILQAEICFPLFSTRHRALFGLLAIGKSELGYASYKGRNIFWLKSVVENAGIMLDNFYHHELANALIPYVGRSWADEMRRNKEGFRERLSGHRTWVSVLMVDIRHFTSISSRMDPKDVVDLLKDFRARIASIVYRYQGTIDKFIGDAIMIVFGLPILPELSNPDKNCVECALEILKEMEPFNKRRGAAGSAERLSIGIGISSGDVIAGNVDSGDRVEYTVIGDAANMVARLEDLAGDNQILLSPATYQRVPDIVVTNQWEPRMLTGFNDPVIIHELLCLQKKGKGDSAADKSNPPMGHLAVNQ